METDCTSSVCRLLSWWARKTSPARKTTSGQPRSPAVFVSDLSHSLSQTHTHTHSQTHNIFCFSRCVKNTIETSDLNYIHKCQKSQCSWRADIGACCFLTCQFVVLKMTAVMGGLPLTAMQPSTAHVPYSRAALRISVFNLWKVVFLSGSVDLDVVKNKFSGEHWCHPRCTRS